VSEWIEVRDRLPEENAGRLVFTDGKREFSGYYRNGQFVAETPTAAGTGDITPWSPPGIVAWRIKGANELG